MGRMGGRARREGVGCGGRARDRHPRGGVRRPGLVARRSAVIAAAVLAAQGCVSSAPATCRRAEPLSELARERITEVRVVAGSASESRILDPWRKSNAAGRGAAAGAAITLGAGMQGAGETYGLSVLAGIVLAPAGAVIGAIAGVAAAKSDAEAQREMEAVVESVKLVHPEQDIPGRVCTLVRTETRLRVNIAPASGVGPGSGAGAGGAVLVFGLEGYGLRGSVLEPNPDMRPFITMRGRLVDAGSVLLIHELVWDREADPRKLDVWASSREDLRAEFARMSGDIARAASDEMFRLVVVP